MSVIAPADRAEFWMPRGRACTYCCQIVPDDTAAMFWLAEEARL